MLEICLALSMHVSLAGDWNETHPCVKYTNSNITIGAYLNSEGEVSTYSSFTFDRDGWFAEIGLTSGYSGFDLAPFVRAGYQFSEQAKFFVAPAATVKGDVGLVIGFEVSNTLEF